MKMNNIRFFSNIDITKIHRISNEKSLSTIFKGKYPIRETKSIREINRHKKIRFFNDLTFARGNIMNIDLLLVYPDINGDLIEMRSLKREWMRIEPHRGLLLLYEDLGHEGKKEKVGFYDYCWDYELDLPMATFGYSEKLILDVVTKIKINSNIIRRLHRGLPPEISTEYYGDTINKNGKMFQINLKNSKGQRRLENIAIVEYGNCNASQCYFKKI